MKTRKQARTLTNTNTLAQIHTKQYANKHRKRQKGMTPTVKCVAGEFRKVFLYF